MSRVVMKMMEIGTYSEPMWGRESTTNLEEEHILQAYQKLCNREVGAIIITKNMVYHNCEDPYCNIKHRWDRQPLRPSDV